MPAVDLAWTLPHPRLRPYVDRYWTGRGAAGTPLPALLPGTGAELMWHLARPFLLALDGATWARAPQAHVGYLRSQPLHLAADADFAFISVRIRTGALRHFCPQPMSDNVDSVLAADALWGASATTLGARLMEAPDLHARARLVDDWMLACLERFGNADRLIEDASAQLYYHPAHLALDALPRRYDLSLRQFERRFKAAIGCSPKTYQRMARFHKTVRDLMLSRTTEYLDLALTHGYYDQAHFIREFSGFVGQTPARFLKTAHSMSHFYNPSLRDPP